MMKAHKIGFNNITGRTGAGGTGSTSTPSSAGPSSPSSSKKKTCTIAATATVSGAIVQAIKTDPDEFAGSTNKKRKLNDTTIGSTSVDKASKKHKVQVAAFSPVNAENITTTNNIGDDGWVGSFV
jgi:hypothetical protein